MPLAIVCTVKYQIYLKGNFLLNTCNKEDSVKPASCKIYVSTMYVLLFFLYRLSIPFCKYVAIV